MEAAQIANFPLNQPSHREAQKEILPLKVSLVALGVILMIGSFGATGLFYKKLGCLSFCYLTGVPIGIVLIALGMYHRSSQSTQEKNKKFPEIETTSTTDQRIPLDQKIPQVQVDQTQEKRENPQTIHLKKMTPTPFNIQEGQNQETYLGNFVITTANVGMLPQLFHTAQEIPNKILSWMGSLGNVLSPNRSIGLKAPSERCHLIADRFSRQKDRVPIVCLQEAFDRASAQILRERFVADGYSVVYDTGGSFFVNSGLLVASLYPIEKTGVQFWRYTNLSHTDQFSSKGLLRVPLSIPSKRGEALNVVLYVTHLQAQRAYPHIRHQQLTEILKVIHHDQETHPNALIFLAGDLNISDWDEGIEHNEYQEKKWFFDCFHDYVNLNYGNQGARTVVASPWSQWDLDQKFTQSNEEPTGTFYAQSLIDGGVTAFLTKTEQGCLYDRILLYKKAGSGSGSYDLAIRRMFDEGYSDHLPVTLLIDLEDPFSPLN